MKVLLDSFGSQLGKAIIEVDDEIESENRSDDVEFSAKSKFENSANPVGAARW